MEARFGVFKGIRSELNSIDGNTVVSSWICLYGFSISIRYTLKALKEEGCVRWDVLLGFIIQTFVVRLCTERSIASSAHFVF
jgi:hypothetical protein